MIKCLIFDLDGTLINTLEDLATTSNELLIEYGYKEIDIDKYRYFIGNGIKKLLERCLIYSNGNIKQLDELYNKFTINYEEKCLRFAFVYNNIKELLDKLKNMGILLFVNTNKAHNIAVKIINTLLPNLFIDVYGDNVNYPRKPDPYIINKIKDEYYLNNEEILYVGDSNVDVYTAHNANIEVIGCNYGFRGEKELRDANVDYLINDPLEILKIINK